MGEIIDFAELPRGQNSTPCTTLENDPYYRFIRNVLVTANACGFNLPFSINSATEHVYRKTRDTSELARLLRNSLS